jgi:xanthine dehydrogenase small subunit
VIRFLLGDREVALEDRRADITVLEYLRSDIARRGSKEGCASGDCGACTVAVVSVAGDGLRYEPVNACIAPLGSVHGRQLITVEDLGDAGAWHPVQRAMIECHGSQCGFCTPGFVMSLFVLFHQPGEADRARIIEALGGNLCRCTGYLPIIQAARQALSGPREDRFTRAASITAEVLQGMADAADTSAALNGEDTRYLRPASRDELRQQLAADPQARLVAGGTDLMLEATQALNPLPRLIDLRAVGELHLLEADDDGISIGAAISHRAAAPLILGDYPELAELIERFGSLQIRSQGTLVGNLANASPIGDWPPVLLALGAELCIDSLDGERRLPVDRFFHGYRRTDLKPGEYLHSVRLPRRAGDLFLRAYKISKRFEDDISSVCGVFALRCVDGEVVEARVAFGGMDAVPRRAAGCEQALLGLDLHDADLSAAASALRGDYRPISDARASAHYRSLVAARLLDRLQAEFRGEATRVLEPGAQATHG